MEKKKNKKKRRIIFIILVILVLLFFIPRISVPLFYRAHNHHSLNHWMDGRYTEVEYRGERASYMIPSPDECDGYESASFYWNDNLASNLWMLTPLWLGTTFCQYAVCLELTYNEETYLSAKENALTSYQFLEAPVIYHSPDTDEDYYEMPITETEIGEYTIKIVDDRKYTDNNSPIIRDEENGKFTWFPKRYGFLAFNDEKMKIRYCYIEEISRDFMKSEDWFIRYIKNNFAISWK